MNVDFLGKIKVLDDHNISVTDLNSAIGLKSLFDKDVKVFIDSEVSMYSDFVEFILSNNGKVERNFNQGVIKNKIDGEDKLTCQGLFSVSFDNSVNFSIGCFFVKSKDYQDDIITVIYTNDLSKYMEFRERFLQNKLKNKVLISGITYKIKDTYKPENLLNSSSVLEIKEDIDKFFDKKSGINVLCLVGPEGSGKCTFIKSLATQTNYKFYVLTDNINNEIFANTFQDAEQYKSILYLEYADNWIENIDSNLLNELLESSESENLFIIVSCEDISKIPISLSERRRCYKKINFEVPNEKTVLNYFNEIDEKLVKQTFKKHLKEGLVWEDLSKIKNDLNIVKNSKQIESGDFKNVVDVVFKEKKLISSKIGLDKYFE